MANQPKNYTFHVSGMHCKSCVVMIESELKDVPAITSAKSRLDRCSLEITGDFGEKTENAIAEDLTQALAKHGYRVSTEKRQKKVKWDEFIFAAPVAIAFIAVFIVLQKIGLVNLAPATGLSYGTAFVIGIIASLSTCMAVVGGLVLSLSATFAKEGDQVRPQLLFHAGRVISFFILGGVIGALGARFTLNTEATFILGALIALTMLILGVNLLDVFHWARRLQVAMPKFVSAHVITISKFNHTLTPFFVGVATFFLPCGFTQSMQLATLTTGTFLKGGLTMLSFALGTLPVLALVSFSSLSIKDHAKAGIFFKTAGLIVILFALFNFTNSLVVVGVLPPIFNF